MINTTGLLVSLAIFLVLVGGAAVLNVLVKRPRDAQEGFGRENWSDAFRSPRWKKVSGHNFVNESVALDGNSFDDCSFSNVKLVFHGTAPTEFRDNCRFGNSVTLTTDNPAVMLYANLERVFSAIPGAQIARASVDAKGHELQPRFSIQEVTPQPSLRDRVFATCEELESLLSRHGKRPNPYVIPTDNAQEYTRIYNETVQAWDNKFQADYWKNFKDGVLGLRHEMAIKSVTSEALDKRLTEAETAALADVTVQEIARNLRLLAAQL